MRHAQAIPATALILLLAACGDTRAGKASHVSRAEVAAAPAPAVTHRSAPVPAAAQALATDETENRLLVVDLPRGRVARRVSLPADPEDIAATASGGVVVVVSAAAGEVTVLDRPSLHRLKTFGGFDRPHIAAISPDGRHAYITDDASGTLTAIRLHDMRVTSTVRVGAGAHHLTFSPDQRRLWVALGESASRISILDVGNPDHPRLIGRFSPGFRAHDLSFSPDGRQVWITSAAGPDVTAFDSRHHQALFRVPVGPPPQHVVFAGGYAYLTSGYGSRVEKVGAATGRVLARSGTPYGSFELAIADGYVALSSLLRGTLAIYTPDLRPLRVVKIAPVVREVAISRP